MHIIIKMNSNETVIFELEVFYLKFNMKRI